MVRGLLRRVRQHRLDGRRQSEHHVAFAERPNAALQRHVPVREGQARRARSRRSGPTAAPDCTTFAAQLAQCNTTVSEYTKCFAQNIDAVQTLESHLPICSQGATQTAANDAFSHLSSDCVTLRVTCPMSFVPWSN